MRYCGHQKSKLVLSLLFSAAFVLILSGCGASSNASSSSSVAEADVESPVSYLAKTATELRQYSQFENVDLIDNIQSCIENDGFYTRDYPSYPEFGVCFVNFDNVSYHFIGYKDDVENMVLSSVTITNPDEFSYGGASYSLKDDSGEWILPSALLDFDIPETDGFQIMDLYGYEDESASIIALNKDGLAMEPTAKTLCYAIYSVGMALESKLTYEAPFAELEYLGIADEFYKYIDDECNAEGSSLLATCYDGHQKAYELLCSDGQYYWGNFSDLTSDMFYEVFFLLDSESSDPTDTSSETGYEDMSQVEQTLSSAELKSIAANTASSLALEWKNDYNNSAPRDYRINSTRVLDMLASIKYSGPVAIVTTEIEYWIGGGSPTGSVYAVVTIDLNTGDVLSATLN